MKAKSKTPVKKLPPSWIAEREYTRLDVPGRVVVRIGCPEPDPIKSAHGEVWRCPLQIEGLDLTQIEDLRLDKDAPLFGYGVDSMDALKNAFRSIHVLLKRHGTPLRWERTQEETFGLPVQVPTGYGVEFDRRMEEVINAIDAAISERLRPFYEQMERYEARRKARKKPRTE
ncbi:DUF6968 family protein [Polyangium fumosum]|uniref:DUF6968 domain-containing protein n=1 Tax=Polyangium fumosum TaxID=889272 RepID=A0A4U1IVN9_9BACT|nr:hypothetical protein [Polyangium fumosum]TKC98530.1 hypothetical protein E8A74_40955 [Polyangium fumosum]